MKTGQDLGQFLFICFAIRWHMAACGSDLANGWTTQVPSFQAVCGPDEPDWRVPTTILLSGIHYAYDDVWKGRQGKENKAPESLHVISQSVLVNQLPEYNSILMSWYPAVQVQTTKTSTSRHTLSPNLQLQDDPVLVCPQL